MENNFGLNFDETIGPYASFKHGLVTSKIWLCEELERVIKNRAIKNPDMYLLGSWHNLLSFMLIVRNPKLYNIFNCYDKDHSSIAVSNQICDTWQYEYPRVMNHHRNVDDIEFSSAGDQSIFINCSVDQFEGTDWYKKIPDNRLVCLQSTDLPINHNDWEIKQSYDLISDFTNVYKVRELIFSGTKFYDYGTTKYKRHMFIGIK
jgi:hypothetical protein